MKINDYYKLNIKQHKFRLQYLKYQIYLTFVETMEINGGILILVPLYINFLHTQSTSFLSLTCLFDKIKY